MDQQPNVSVDKSSKPSKILALIAIIIAFALPFILVKTFHNKQRIAVNDTTNLLLPSLEEEISVPEAQTDFPSEMSTEIIDKPQETHLEPVPTANREMAKPPTVEQPTKKTVAEVKQPTWKIVKTRDKDSLANVFSRVGLSAKTLAAVIHDISQKQALTKLKPNQELQFLIKDQLLEKLILPYTDTQYLVIYRDNKQYKSEIKLRKMNSYNHFLTATIKGSLYGTAKRQNIPYKLIQQMTEIFTWDIDFAKDVKTGDQFTIMYKAFYVEDKLVGTGDIIAVSYRNDHRTFQAVRHTTRSGRTDYYTPQGTSLKKAFTRYPLKFSHISSTFSLSRYHPILHYNRAHKGIDLAARIGTPIQATGDGKIEMIGRQSGYGNMIKINHNKKFSTIYGHMLKFQKGLSKGDFVKRGQVIGYVGQTGLASGPHCHYEFHINHQPKNPATVDLPRGDPIAGKELATFRSKATTLLAQLKLFEDTRLASSTKKGIPASSSKA
ncbi:peptidase, M23/M37 family [Legionella beliardensis]|uniref:Peptidase, M23/M37 family n=1 Tax=Legionella beliardensis TaxID=91822 RepID=A0A378IC73_9GAMM|nr:peptidoglycan DD-metalloendopeptidase family protein [Legionella beliardensis]STX29894.1 peptidase, M23/M37 family [Legionella beliardensis]